VCGVNVKIKLNSAYTRKKNCAFTQKQQDILHFKELQTFNMTDLWEQMLHKNNFEKPLIMAVLT
jgi:hypothetical protein